MHMEIGSSSILKISCNQWRLLSGEKAVPFEEEKNTLVLHVGKNDGKNNNRMSQISLLVTSACS